MGVKVAPVIGYVGVLLGVPLGDADHGGGPARRIVKGMMAAPVRLKQVYAMVCYAPMPGLIFLAAGDRGHVYEASR